MKGKRVLITGGSNGIGRATAEGLVALGADVVIVGRDPRKTEQVAREIHEKYDANVDYFLADLSSQASVSQLADEVLQRYNRLDVLVNNAGGVFDTRRTTVDGLEYTFALNHLAYFLLTNRLLDLLKASAPARIVSVSSGAQAGGKINFDDPQFTRHYHGFPAYAQSKLANVMFTYALARRLAGTGVTANTLHPGFVGTGFGDNSGPAMRLVFRMIKRFSISPEQGADTVIYLASNPDVADVSGQYFVKRKPRRTNPRSYDEAAQERLWSISEQLVAQTSHSSVASVSSPAPSPSKRVGTA